jgi:hypothetical protein
MKMLADRRLHNPHLQEKDPRYIRTRSTALAWIQPCCSFGNSA